MELAKTLHCPWCGVVIPREEILEKRKCSRCGWVFNLKWLGGADSEISDSTRGHIGDPGERGPRVDYKEFCGLHQSTGSDGLDMTYIRDGKVYDNLFALPLQADISSVQVKSPILAEASELIHGDRAKDYGDAKESFAHIAALWSAYLKATISPQDVAMMMSLLKMSRAKHSGFTHRDSFVDMAGYVALASDISE